MVAAALHVCGRLRPCAPHTRQERTPGVPPTASVVYCNGAVSRRLTMTSEHCDLGPRRSRPSSGPRVPTPASSTRPLVGLTEVAVLGRPARAARLDLRGGRLGGRRQLMLGGVEGVCRLCLAWTHQARTRIPSRADDLGGSGCDSPRVGGIGCRPSPGRLLRRVPAASPASGSVTWATETPTRGKTGKSLASAESDVIQRVGQR
jgi:hypothetical protein